MPAVTCPTVRIHPAIVAQAAATSAVLLEGRFSFGVGSGEALNEHILGDRWPEIDVRMEMLEEAVQVIRTLWQGGQCSHHGRHYTVENARVYDLPDEPPPMLVSGFGPKATKLAARIGDGFSAVAQRGMPGELAQVLPTPAHFEQACELVEPERLVTPVGPNLDKHVASLRQYSDAGVDELFVQQIGPEQDAFFDQWAAEILPQFAGAATR